MPKVEVHILRDYPFAAEMAKDPDGPLAVDMPADKWAWVQAVEQQGAEVYEYLQQLHEQAQRQFAEHTGRGGPAE